MPARSMIWILLAVSGMSQTTPATGSIRGVVRDAVTGQPLDGAQIRASVNPTQPNIQLTADSQGR